jgi:long-chain fatty acid transport protein
MKSVLFRHSAIITALVLISSAFRTGPAFGAGFALPVQSASGLGNSFAGVGAAAEDASTIYWNPAGMSKLPAGKQFVGSGEYIMPSIKFRDGGSAAAINRTDFGNTGGNVGHAVFVPNAYFAMDFTPALKFGIGLNVPFGLKTQYDAAWLGRFQGIKSELESLNVNPSLSWKVTDQVAVGFGVNYQTAKVNLLTGINYKGLVAGTPLDPAIAANAEGQNQTDVRGHAWGYNLGVLFDLGANTRLGVAYRSSLKYNLSGTTSFSNVPAGFAFSPALAAGTADGNVNLSVKTPASLSISLAHQANQQWTMLAGMTWTGWSIIQSPSLVRDTGATVSTLTFNFKDTMFYSAGANYKLNETWTLKMGVALDRSPVPSAQVRSVRLPDNDSTWLSFGAKYKLSGSGAIDFGYTYLKFKDAPINNVQNNPAAAQVNGDVIGSYRSSVHVVGVQYTHSF